MHLSPVLTRLSSLFFGGLGGFGKHSRGEYSFHFRNGQNFTAVDGGSYIRFRAITAIKGKGKQGNNPQELS